MVLHHMLSQEWSGEKAKRIRLFIFLVIILSTLKCYSTETVKAGLGFTKPMSSNGSYQLSLLLSWNSALSHRQCAVSRPRTEYNRRKREKLKWKGRECCSGLREVGRAERPVCLGLWVTSISSSRYRGYTTVPLGEQAGFWDDNNPWKKENKEICIWKFDNKVANS